MKVNAALYTRFRGENLRVCLHRANLRDCAINEWIWRIAMLRSTVTVVFVLACVGTANADGIRITEYMYAGSTNIGGEFIEFTNLSAEPVDMAGWSFDDDAREPGAFDLSGFGVVMPGESVVLTEDDPEDFRSDWGLGLEVKIIGHLGDEFGNNIGRNDELNLYNQFGDLVDRLTYGDQAFPSSVRTRWFSGNPVSLAAVGANDAFGWVLSVEGDIYGSIVSAAGDVGNPGSYLCSSLPGDANRDGFVNLDDLNLVLASFGQSVVPGTLGDVNADGTIDLDDLNLVLTQFGLACSFEAPEPVSSVEFSSGGGLFHDGLALILTTEDATASIYYTMDGSEPTLSSSLYTQPIEIQSRQGEPDYFALIQAAPPPGWALPVGETFKASVVRAAAIRPDGTRGEVTSHTYIVDQDIQSRYTLPIVSLMIEEDDFWGYVNGIYVPGQIYDKNFDPDIEWWRREANYTQRGSQWERTLNFEFFEPGGVQVLNHLVGGRIHGGATRSRRQKSLRLYADSSYGPDRFEHELFPGDAVTSFKRILLRNSGNDWGVTMIHDAIVQSLASEAGLDGQAYRPAVVFLNGEYWGIHNIRERLDRYCLESRFDADPNEVDMLTGNGETTDEIDEGDNSHYLAMRDFVFANNMQIQSNFDWVATQMDIENHIDYFAVQVYIVNNDWPQNNIDFWRPRTPDGRWRWLLYDTDFGFRLDNIGSTPRPEFDALRRVAVTMSSPNAILFRRLLDNSGYRQAFVNRSADIMNTVFDPDYVISRVDEFEAGIANEMPEFSLRWRRHTAAGGTSWASQVDRLRQFAVQRPEYARQQIVDHFGLDGTAHITINNPTPERGRVWVNRVDVEAWGYPWTGVYFQGVDLPITVEANEGYVFEGFVEIDGVQGELTVLVPDGDIELTPVFIESGR